MFEDALRLALVAFVIILVIYVVEVIGLVRSLTMPCSEKLTAPSFRDADIAVLRSGDIVPFGDGKEHFAPYPSILSADVLRSDDQSDRAPRTSQPQRYNQRSSEDMLFNQINAVWI